MPGDERGTPVVVRHGPRAPWDARATLLAVIRHATRDLVWRTLESVEHWEREDPRTVAGQPLMTRREVVLVRGPLLKTLKDGRFLLEVACYGDDPPGRAWIIP